MAITAKQLEQRKKYLGSSDIAALHGLDPWRNAHDVFLEKTGKLSPEKDKAVFRRGRYMELGLLAFAEDELGPIEHDEEKLEFIIEDLNIIDHPDSRVHASGNPIEAKSQGYFAEEHWGDAGTDQVPDRAIIQSHVHMRCLGSDFCHVPYAHPMREYLMFGVPFSQKIWDNIAETALKFWNDHVLKDTPPPPTAHFEVLKRIIRVPKKTISIPDEVFCKARDDRDARLAAEKAEDASKAIMIALLGDAEAATCGAGRITYFEQIRNGVDLKAIKKDLPNVVKRYATVTTHRTLRFKKGK